MYVDSEDVKQAVVEQLLSVFPDITVYKEATSTPVYPHFFVYQITLSDEEERRGYHLVNYSMEVRYRVASDPSTVVRLEQNLDNIAFILSQNFNIINLESSKVKCIDKSLEKIEGVLHFMFAIQILMKDVSVVGDGSGVKQNSLALGIIKE